MAASDIIIKCEEFIDSEENIEDINQTFFNDYDEHRHDSEPENNENRKMDSECENDDIKLQEILQEFDLEILFTLLKFSDITYRSLLYISENDINTAIRSIAYRAEFREKLFAWRRDKYNLNDVSVLPPPKQSSMPLGVNNSHNIPLSNTNTNRDSNSPMNTTTSTKPSSGLTAPRAKRTLSPKTSAAKKSRTTSQAASDSRVSVSSPTRTSSSEALSISQHGTKTRPSIDFDKPLCFKPTTSSAAAAATTSSMTPITDSFLSEPPTEYAEFIQAPSEVSLLGEPQPKTTIGKQKKTKVSPKRSKKYSEDDLTQAIDAIRNGLFLKSASRKFGIPRSTIHYRLKTNLKSPRHGPSTILTKAEEKLLADWIITSSIKGFCIRKGNLFESVGQFLKANPRTNAIVNDKPGVGWYKLFLKRHPEIELQISQVVTATSADGTESNVRQWFTQIENYLSEQNLKDILADPTRLYIAVETNFELCAKKINMLAKKDAKNTSCISVMLSYSANGETISPMIIYPHQKLSCNISESLPLSWSIESSGSGWMNRDLFYKYIVDFFHTQLVARNVQFPIILFVESIKSPLSYELSESCRKKGIILIAHYPNLKWLNEQAAVSVYKPIECAFQDWRQINCTKTLTEEAFGVILVCALEKYNDKSVLKNNFKTCGLFPWNAKTIDNA